MESNFYDIFPDKKPLIGMLHLAGVGSKEKINRALEEIKIYEKGGFDGAIIEDYHGSLEDIEAVLNVLKKQNSNLVFGINILRNPYLAFEFADRYGAKFIQFDTIQTSKTETLNPGKFNERKYAELRTKYPNISVFGGVRFKYIPSTGKSLEEDIWDGVAKCDAIVTTGEGTGIETPTQKLRDFREILGTFPLIVGAGVNDENILEQMKIVDGAIIGSYLKDYNTKAIIQEERVRKLVNLVRAKT
jgi:hypothetical protein